MNFKASKEIMIYIACIILFCSFVYLLLKPNVVKHVFSSPSQAHIEFLSHYGWTIKKTTNTTSFELYSYPWLDEYKRMGLDLTPYINKQLETSTYLLHEEEKRIDDEVRKIYMTIYEHNGEILGRWAI